MLALCVFAVCHAASAVTRSVDLDESIELALLENRSLVLTALDVRSARFGIERAESAFDIEIRPVLEYGTLDDRSTSVFGVDVSKRLRSGTEVGVTVLSEDFDTSIGRRARLAIELNQPLFRRFGRLVNEEPIEQATSALRRSERIYHAQRSNLVLDVISSYETIQRLRQQVAADESSLQRAAELLQSTRAKESLGRTTRIDVLRVELQKGLAESRLAADQQRLESEYQAFAELLGLDPDVDFDLAELPIFDIDLPSTAAAVAQALDNRLDYAQALHDRIDAERGAALAENLLLPDVRLTSRYEQADKPLAFSGDRNRWFFGVRGDTNLNTRSARIDVDRAYLEEASAAQRIRVVEMGIAREVRQAMLAYRQSRADLVILEANLENADARLELAQRLFEAGRSDNFSVTDAEEAYLNAQSRLFSGRADASLSAYGLLHTLGVLIEFPDMLKPDRSAQ